MIQSVDRALRILGLFLDKETLTLTEISRKMDLPKSTVFGLLETLEAHHYLKRDSETARYSLGVSLLELGGLYSSRLSIRDVAFPTMQALCEKSNQAATLSVLSGFNIVYLERMAPQNQLYFFDARVGSTYSAHCVATGKMLLALLPEQELDSLLKDRTLPRVTEHTITDPQEFREELRKIRERGYAMDNRESHSQVYSIAYPIFDYSGKAVAALSCGGFIGEILDNEESMRKLIRAASERISRELGYKTDMYYPL